MKPKILFIIFPIFIINSGILIYLYLIELHNALFGALIGLISLIPTLLLLKLGLLSSQSHFNNISKRTVDITNIELTFEDGVKTTGKIYRSTTDTKETAKGSRYSNPQRAIIFFHGFYASKEINEKFLIPLAHMGYVTIAFDQRGHGTAGGKKSDWYNLYNDVDAILDRVSSLEDVKSNSLVCIGISMGGTSVLTRCYQDDRVSMVIGISTLHDVDKYLASNSSIFSRRWFIKRIMAKAKGDETNQNSLKLTAHHFLKRDPEFNENRVYLIHGEDDKLFPPSLTFQLNKQQAQIPENHAILLDNCRHNITGQETLVLSIILRWIREHE